MMTTLHLLGVFLLFSGLGALALADGNGSGARKLPSIAHGTGLLVILATGVSLLVTMGFSSGMPLWVWGKIAIWVVFGGVVVAFRRAPDLKVPLFFSLPILGAIAAWLALTRPG